MNDDKYIYKKSFSNVSNKKKQNNEKTYLDNKKIQEKSQKITENFIIGSHQFFKNKLPFDLLNQNTQINDFIKNIKGNYADDDEKLRENLPFTKKLNGTQNSFPSLKYNEEIKSNNADKVFINPLQNDSKSSIHNFIEESLEKIIQCEDSAQNSHHLYDNELEFERNIPKNNSLSKEIDDDNLGFKQYNNFHKLINIKSKISENKLISKTNKKSIFSQNEDYSYKKNRELFKFDNVYDSMSCNEEDDIKYYSFHLDLTGDFKRTWDMIIFFFILYSIIFYPYLISFVYRSLHMEKEIISECVFLIDFLLNFFTSFHDIEENNITNLKEIIINYLKDCFFIDFITCIPFSLIISIYQQMNPLLNYENDNNIKFLICLQWIGLLRVFRLEKKDADGFITKINVFDNTRNNRLLKSSLYFFLIVHITSCLWVFIGKIQSSSGLNWIIGNEFQDYGNWDLYVASFYFNLVTVYSIGYGDILAFTIIERVYISFFMSISVILFSYAISNFVSYLIDTDQINFQKRNKLEVFNKLNVEFDLPSSLFNKIRRYLEFLSGKNYNERYCLLEFLPNKLKGDLTLSISKNNHLKKLCFFESQSNDFIVFVLPKLLSYNLLRGEIVFSIGEYVGEMYLVIRGS